MIPFLCRRAASTAVASVTLALLAGCTDLPTGAEAFQLQADGLLWTAVAPPPDLPTAASWLQFSATGSADGIAAAEAVASLQAEAEAARIAGDAARADELLAAAAVRAVEAMTRDPGPGLFLTGMASLEGWQRRVRSGVDLASAPELSAAVDAVARDRDAVEAAVLEGDNRLAALRLTRAADRVRDWAPEGVALRALDRAVAVLDRSAVSEEDDERIAHLVRSAREELVRGEPLRAVRRALYALQLANGNGIAQGPPDERARCGEFSC